MNGIEVVEMEGKGKGKGRGLVASQPLKGGQIILKDSPILLYSAFPLTTSTTTTSSSSSSSSSSYCANCFKRLVVAQIQCTSCLEVFCSPDCSSSQSHSPWVCQTLTRLRQALSVTDTKADADADADAVELHQQARFLVAAYNLAIHSPFLFQTLLSLQGSSSSVSAAAAQFLHPLIVSTSTCFSFSVEMSAALLSKDKLNAFGLMEPFKEEEDSGSSVRAYGIYPKASLFNHDCLPNACRFDYVDSTNTDITIRMIHDVPAGREICISYFPVNLNFPTRQKRLMDDYGFTCYCDRCKVEANWSDQEEDEYLDNNNNNNMEEDEDEDEDNDTMVNMEQQLQHDDNEEDTSFPHAYFFVRYMCNRNNCWGTLAPLPPPPSYDDNNVNNVVMECNVCGNLQTHQHHPY